MNEVLKDLNEEQLSAVTHKDGPLLIIAGAGTGKTAVITRRIAWLISEGLASPNQILALTFTDKASVQMQERVDVMVPYGYTDIWISTFHAFGDRILRENALELGIDPDFAVLTRPESAVFFREHLFDFKLSYYRPLGDPTKFIDAMIDAFNRAKDEDISPSEYLKFVEKLKEDIKNKPQDNEALEYINQQSEIAECYLKYQELLLKECKVDFGNQFYLALELFRKRPLVLKAYQEQFKYVLVDEFQDTNYAQFQLIKLLADRIKNITVVADDDQCIYRWRGAAYSNVLNFIDAYPDAKKISLIKNYRSTQAILDAAYRLIQHNNPDRFEVKSQINKKLIGTSEKGASPEHLSFDTISSESDAVAKLIKEKVDSKKYSYKDFAILVRSNNDADPYLRSLNMNGVPWRFSGSQGLYSKDEVKMCVSFLKVMADINDSLDMYFLATSDIYNIQVEALVDFMHQCRRQNESLYWVLNKAQLEKTNTAPDEIVKIESFLGDLKKYLAQSKDISVGRLLYLFLTETGYIKNLVDKQTGENEERLENIAKFFDLVRDFESISKQDRVIYFVNYLDLLIEAGDDPATAQADLDVDAVNVMTIHKAKGLEFKVVFMVSLVQGKFPWPHRKKPIELPDVLFKDALPTGDFHIQEERRLFYVGMTRAKDELYLTSGQDYGGNRPRKISQFVYEALQIEKDKVDLKKSSAKQKIDRNAPPVKSAYTINNNIPPSKILNLSFYQIDDYLTCPLKYKFVHILRVPILEHHTVIYGKAMHDAIQTYHQHKIKSISISAEDLFTSFNSSFKAEGFLEKRHINERLSKARETLERFYKEQESSNKIPAYVEKEFSFIIGADKVSGRWDRIDMELGKAVIIDFKTSEVKKQAEADRRAKESLQLNIYALSYKTIFGVLPERVELHFLESSLIGKAQKSEDDLEETIDKIKQASFGIRNSDFSPKPDYLACNYCAFNKICSSAVNS